MQRNSKKGKEEGIQEIIGHEEYQQIYYLLTIATNFPKINYTFYFNRPTILSIIINTNSNKHPYKMTVIVLAGVAQWTEHRPVN